MKNLYHYFEKSYINRNINLVKLFDKNILIYYTQFY